MKSYYKIEVRIHVQESIRKEAVNRFSEAFSKTGRGTFGNVLDYKKSS